MKGEILNIEFHVRRLLIKALNSSKTESQAASKLEVSKRTLWRYKKQYCIVKEGKRFVEKQPMQSKFFAP